MQRYFITAESTYENLRQSLNTQLAYPNSLGKSVFQTSLQAPRDGFRRVLLAVDTAIPNYSAINTALSPLLDSDAVEEIDEATYLAAVASATAGASSWNDITGKPTTLAGYGITDAATSLHTHSVGDLTATGTPSATTFLRGDGSWQAAGSTNAGDLVAGTLADDRLSSKARAAINTYLWSTFR